MDTLRFLDILGFVVGLIYLILEYRASIWLWVASFIMPAVDMFLYYKAGLYADFGMAVYYCLAAIYGFIAWKFSRGPAGSANSEVDSAAGSDSSGSDGAAGSGGSAGGRPVTHFRRSAILPALAAALLLWLGIWWILVTFTNSTVPIADAFTTALSIVALWALAQKYAEQWLLWLVVDIVCCILYVSKGIPFKAAIYGLYTIIAVFGYRKWLKMIA